MSLRAKMAFSIVGMMLLLSLLVLSQAILESWRRTEDERARRALANHELVARWLEARTITSRSALEESLFPLAQSGAISSYAVVAPDGTLETHHADAVRPVAPERLGELARGELPSGFYRQRISLDGRTGSTLVVEIEGATIPARSNLGYLLGLFWTLVLGTALLAMLLVLLLNSALLRPMRRLVDASRRIAVGDYSPDFGRHERTDELGQLMTAFSYMLEEVRTYHEELEERMREAREQIRQTERSLVVAQRLAATGTLAAGIAHEINNPIGGMQNAAYWIAKGGEDKEKRKQYAELIIDGLTRIRETVRKVLSFTPKNLEPRPTELRTVVEQARSLVEHRLKEAGIGFEVELPTDFPALVIDPLEFQQVFLNLLLNAADAMSRGGTIRVHGQVRDQEAILSVEDDGIGMTPEVASQALDLFFTTKEPGKGTGLGLSIVHNIVHNHGGNLEIHSAPGQGTTIRITLPIPA